MKIVLKQSATLPQLEDTQPWSEAPSVLVVTLSRDRLGDCPAVNLVGPPKSADYIEYALVSYIAGCAEYEFARHL